ncbi:hypothetical protein AAFC00_002627 [Neodothiora populina]|uniref:CoA-binding domain-containing protein n=1 Tax=Neodothiora populina TaxID=2781224 RepID=A0ABR3P8F3_9PEZI
MSTTDDMQAAAKKFFSSPHYAVAGASSDAAKFGNKIFAWYLDQGIQPTPLNPRASSISVRNNNFQTAAAPSALKNASSTSLSIVTPPAVTKQLLKDAKDAGIQAVWLQPGTFDDDVLEQAKEQFPGAAVGGFEGLSGCNRHEGWCVLVHGEGTGAGTKDGKL